MARRTAAKGTKRPRKPSPSAAAAVGGGAENVPLQPAKGQASDGGGGGGFFCCYLLRSLCPRSKGRTYIGFTVNPRRRLRQHNGEIRSGAWKTRRGRPWEMLLCIHAFTSNVAALQFEWAWQHPTESLAVRKAASSFKSLGGVGNKVKLAYTMLNLPSWENLNLTVNFFSSKNNKFTAGCPSLPSHMKMVVCPMEDLQCYVEGPASSEEDNINDDPQGHQEPDAPLGDEHTEHSWQQITSELQPMDEQIRNAEDDMDSVGDFAPMEWGGVLGTTELDWSRTSPQCSLSPGDDHGGIAVDNEPGQVSPLLMFGAGSDDGDDHLLHDRDVVNLVTPTPVGRLRRRDCVASICPKIIDLTVSPVVIQL